MTDLNPSDRAKYALPPKPVRAETIVDRANQLIDIRDVYNNESGFFAPTGEYFSWKIYCPFAYEHADGGIDKNTRMYPPTHIYCWAQHGKITPVFLHARRNGLTQKAAAEELLHKAGLLKPKNFRERWQEILSERGDKVNVRLGSQSYAIDALQKRLALDSDYADHEFDDAVRQSWNYVLETLDAIWDNPESDLTLLQVWLERSAQRIFSAYSQVDTGSTNR